MTSTGRKRHVGRYRIPACCDRGLHGSSRRVHPAIFARPAGAEDHQGAFRLAALLERELQAYAVRSCVQQHLHFYPVRSLQSEKHLASLTHGSSPRSVYRTAELSNGWTGRIISTQHLFSAHHFPLSSRHARFLTGLLASHSRLLRRRHDRARHVQHQFLSPWASHGRRLALGVAHQCCTAEPARHRERWKQLQREENGL